jgi:hypothetical protein
MGGRLLYGRNVPREHIDPDLTAALEGLKKQGDRRMAGWRDRIDKQLRMARARGDALMSRRTAKSIAQFEQRPQGLSAFIAVLVGIVLMAFFDGMLILLAIILCTAILLAEPPYLAAIVVSAALIAIWIARMRE